jgi:triacylglycerol lipase
MHCRSLASIVALSGIGVVCGCAPDAEPPAQESEDLIAAAPLGPEPSGVATRFPILLGHGFGGSESNLTFLHVDDALREDGHHAVRAEVPPFAPVAVRAEALAERVDALLAETGAEKVNLVSHSMGGLDARELVSILGYGDRVASITTISSPHWGTAIADVALGLIEGVPDDALDALAKAFGSSFSAHAEDPDLRAAFADMAETTGQAFNDAHPDDPEVMYQSWAGVSSAACIPNPADLPACEDLYLWHARRADCMDPLLTPMAAIVAHGSELLPNDGLVTVENAKLGTFRGCIPADHADEIGQFGDKPYAANAWTGFDYIRFYRNLAYDLASQGF